MAHPDDYKLGIVFTQPQLVARGVSVGDIQTLHEELLARAAELQTRAAADAKEVGVEGATGLAAEPRKLYYHVKYDYLLRQFMRSPLAPCVLATCDALPPEQRDYDVKPLQHLNRRLLQAQTIYSNMVSTKITLNPEDTCKLRSRSTTAQEQLQCAWEKFSRQNQCSGPLPNSFLGTICASIKDVAQAYLTVFGLFQEPLTEFFAACLCDGGGDAIFDSFYRAATMAGNMRYESSHARELLYCGAKQLGITLLLGQSPASFSYMQRTCPLAQSLETNVLGNSVMCATDDELDLYQLKMVDDLLARCQPNV